MSKRLQVVLSESEFEEVRKFAAREHVAVGEWVRRTLREAQSHQSSANPQSRLKAVRQAAEYAFPTADIDRMLSEIERGYQS